MRLDLAVSRVRVTGARAARVKLRLETFFDEVLADALNGGASDLRCLADPPVAPSCSAGAEVRDALYANKGSWLNMAEEGFRRLRCKN